MEGYLNYKEDNYLVERYPVILYKSHGITHWMCPGMLCLTRIIVRAGI